MDYDYVLYTVLYFVIYVYFHFLIHRVGIIFRAHISVFNNDRQKMRLLRMKNLQILPSDLHSHLCEGHGDLRLSVMRVE